MAAYAIFLRKTDTIFARYTLHYRLSELFSTCVPVWWLFIVCENKSIQQYRQKIKSQMKKIGKMPRQHFIIYGRLSENRHCSPSFQHHIYNSSILFGAIMMRPQWSWIYRVFVWMWPPFIGCCSSNKMSYLRISEMSHLWISEFQDRQTFGRSRINKCSVISWYLHQVWSRRFARLKLSSHI